MSLHKFTPFLLVGEDLRKIHDGLMDSRKFRELVVFDLLCTGLRPAEISRCKAVEMSDNCLFFYFKKSKDSQAYYLPIRKLNVEWMSDFEPGDLLFADPKNSSTPLPIYEILKMVIGWSTYLDDNKVLAIRDFRRLHS